MSQPVRIYREVVDKATGHVRVEDPVELSPITLMMNRLYKPETPLTSQQIKRVMEDQSL